MLEPPALLEFAAPRWVQCAYNPPYGDEDFGEDDFFDDTEEGLEDLGYEDEDLGAGSWSCPEKPPELW